MCRENGGGGGARVWGRGVTVRIRLPGRSMGRSKEEGRTQGPYLGFRV